MTTHDYRATPLLGRMQQVAMTYLSRSLFWWVCGIIAILLLVFITDTDFGKTPPFANNRAARFITGEWFAVAFAACLAWHAKWQFANPIARLTPNYRSPHIGVLALLTVILLGLVPALVSMVTYGSPLGFAAFIIAATGPIFWGAHSNNPIGFFLVMAIGYSLHIPTIQSFWIDHNFLCSPYHLLILLAGWGFVVAWLQRLASLHEERSDYNIPPIAAQFGRASRSERAEQRKLIARTIKKIPLQGWLADRVIDQALAGPPSSSPQLLRHGFMALSAEWRAAWFFLMFGGMSFAVAMILGNIFGGNTDNTHQGNIGVLMMPLVFSLLMPGSFLSQLFNTRRPFMEAELLRPMTRTDYLMGVIRAGLRDAAIQAVAFVGITFLLVGWFSPEMMTPTQFLVFLCAVVACNFFVASFSIWCASFRIGLLQVLLPMLSMIPIALVGIGFTGIWWKLTKGNPGTLEQVGWSVVALGLASVLPLLGLFFLRTAKRRWMKVELG